MRALNQHKAQTISTGLFSSRRDSVAVSSLAVPVDYGANQLLIQPGIDLVQSLNLILKIHQSSARSGLQQDESPRPNADRSLQVLQFAMNCGWNQYFSEKCGENLNRLTFHEIVKWGRVRHDCTHLPGRISFNVARSESKSASV